MRKNVILGLCAIALCVAVISVLQFQSTLAAQADFWGTPNFLPLVSRFDTQTPTPTETASPTPSPTETQPAPPPPGVTVINGPVAFVDVIGYLHVLGEVSNNSGRTIDFVKITANLFNNGHNLVGTGYTYSDPLVMPNGEKTCFDVLINTPPAYSSIEFESPAYDPSSVQPSPGLVIISPSAYTDVIGDYHVIGRVTNTGPNKSKYVELVGTLYDGAGSIVECGFTFVNSTDLSAGQTSSFDLIYIYRSSYANVGSWHLTVNGQQ